VKRKLEVVAATTQKNMLLYLQAGCQDSVVMTLNFYRLPRPSEKFTVSTLKQQPPQVCNFCGSKTVEKLKLCVRMNLPAQLFVLLGCMHAMQPTVIVVA